MAKGTSGYGKKKGQTIKELEEALDTRNPIEKEEEEMNKQHEESRGITQRIRDIFEK